MLNKKKIKNPFEPEPLWAHARSKTLLYKQALLFFFFFGERVTKDEYPVLQSIMQLPGRNTKCISDTPHA